MNLAYCMLFLILDQSIYYVQYEYVNQQRVIRMSYLALLCDRDVRGIYNNVN